MITPLWKIETLWVKPVEGSLTDVVVTAAWRCSATDGQYSGSVYATVSFSPPDPATFIDFSKLTPPEIFARLTADPSILAKHIPMPPPDSWVKLREREGGNFGRMLAAGHPDLTLRRFLHRISVPTLLQWGDKDAILPVGQQAAWASLIPGCTTKTYPGAEIGRAHV